MNLAARARAVAPRPVSRAGPADSAASSYRPYALAMGLTLAGWVATGFIAREVGTAAARHDRERFEHEAQRAYLLVEQKMERYEQALARLADLCAAHGGNVPNPAWQLWIHDLLHVGWNFPDLLLLAVAPRVETESEASASETAVATALEPAVGTPAETVAADSSPPWPGRLPVQQSWRRQPWVALPAGEDLARETEAHPDFRAAFSHSFGWVSTKRRVLAADGEAREGFWFALPLFTPNPDRAIVWQRRNEKEAPAAERRQRERVALVRGVLVAFIDGRGFLDEFNETRATPAVHIQLYTAAATEAVHLLNPEPAAPIAPRWRHVLNDMRWYTRRWTLVVSSTPLFEAGTAGYREQLAWVLGGLMSVLAGGVVAWQTRAWARERAAAAQLRESRNALQTALDRTERVSRDLHDGTIQSVYAVGLGLRRCQQLLERAPLEAGRRLADCTHALNQVIGELRQHIASLAHDTAPPVRLDEALQAVTDSVRQLNELQVHLELDPTLAASFAPRESLHLVNIAREALSNSVRHGQASCVRIGLGQVNGTVEFHLADNGNGCEPSALRDGQGLRNIRERARALGGACDIGAAPGQGTRISVRFPRPASPPTTP